MATSVSVSQLSGYFKEVYGEIERAVPEFAEIQKSVAFQRRAKLGDSYHFPVVLSRSHGVTFNGGANDGTAFTLNSPESLVSKDANLGSSEIVLRERIAYGVVSRAGSSKEAFGESTGEIVMNLKEAASFYLEMVLLYGGSPSGIGLVQGRYTDSGTTQVFQITKASWAPGLWMQMQNAYIDVISTNLATKRNSAGTMQVTAINPEERTITCVGTEAEMDNIIPTDVIFPRGAYTAGTGPVWAYGIDGILQNTGSLFGIDAATYNLWKAASYSVGSAALTMSKAQGALTRGMVRGLSGATKLRVSPYAWTDLNSDLAALRRFAESTKSGLDVGTNSIKFYGVSGGVMEVVPHAMVKAGEAFLGQDETIKRIGSTDTTFNLGVQGQQEMFFRELSDNAGFEIRTYSDQAMVITAPAKWVKLTGIVNQSLPAAATET